MTLIKGELRPHQVLALQEANKKDAHAFYMDPGAGKTLTVITEAAQLHAEGAIDGLIVIAPNGPHRQWVRDEIPKWAEFQWQGAYNKAPAKEQRKFWEKDKRHGLGVLSMNYESLPTANGRKLVDKFLEKYPRVYLAVDESQKVKNHKAKRTIEVEKLARRSAYRRTLSGTPILKGLEDLFAQYYILRPGITGKFATKNMAANWYALRNYFCETAPVPGQRVSAHAKMIVGYRNEAEFRANVRPHSTRVTSDMFMKSEEPDFIPRECPMSGAQAKAYMQMKELLLSQVQGEVITAKNALVQLAKLSQIASGYMLDEDGVAHWLGDNKIGATVDLCEELNEPVIVWSPYIPLKSALFEQLRALDRPAFLYEKPDDVDAWKASDCGIIVGNQASGLGVGMNLQNAAANIYVANSFSSEARWQSLKRTDRIGQERQVRNWDLIAPGTVDEKVLKSLQAKEDIASANIDGLKELLL